MNFPLPNAVSKLERALYRRFNMALVARVWSDETLPGPGPAMSARNLMYKFLRITRCANLIETLALN